MKLLSEINGELKKFLILHRTGHTPLKYKSVLTCYFSSNYTLHESFHFTWWILLHEVVTYIVFQKESPPK